MATYIQSQTGADILELQPANPYPTDYNETGDVAKVERDKNARPEIENLPDSISEYDTIFVGYPIWWHTAPMIIGTFLEKYDLTGVDIYPFSQSASMDTEQFDNSMEFVRENAAGANVHDGHFASKLAKIIVPFLLFLCYYNNNWEKKGVFLYILHEERRLGGTHYGKN